MAIESTEFRIDYAPAVGATVFPYPFPFMAELDIAAIVGDGDSERELFYGIDYSVKGTKNAFGQFLSATVTLAAPLPPGETLRLVRRTRAAFSEQIESVGDHRHTATAGVLNRLTMVTQEQRTEHTTAVIDIREAIEQARLAAEAADASANAAGNSASHAVSIANAAKGVADSANLTALQALSRANTAIDSADQANTTAGNAQILADYSAQQAYLSAQAAMEAAGRPGPQGPPGPPHPGPMLWMIDCGGADRADDVLLDGGMANTQF